MKPTDGSSGEPESTAVSAGISEEAKQKLKMFTSKFPRCTSSQPGVLKSGPGGVVAMDGGDDTFYDSYSPTGEDLEAAGFDPDMLGEPYWEDDQTPFYQPYESEAVAVTQDQTRACFDRVSACNDICDDASDKRGASCAVLTLVYSEVPIAAGIAGVVCVIASNREKNNCKANCPALSTCM